jgi:hypothetical protein
MAATRTAMTVQAVVAFRRFWLPVRQHRQPDQTRPVGIGINRIARDAFAPGHAVWFAGVWIDVKLWKIR